MSARTAVKDAHEHDPGLAPAGPAPHLSPELEEVILEIAASERALDDVLLRASRLHESHLDHDPRSCLVCFGDR
ncbi:hypothetical protein ACFJIY_02820 [Pimelobacter simplex]|uniref:hypothetical protein n=1 Tax=Nocardioides simplex TaxID=2045 RepID=UPI0036708ACD